MDSGTILSPSSIETDSTWSIIIERSVNGGKCWQSIPVCSDDSIKIIQPTLLSFPDNSVQALIRSDRNYIVQSWSVDDGITWSTPTTTNMLNPNSGIDAVTLKSGLQVLVYNPMKKGTKWYMGRNKLNVAISRDGLEWEDVVILENHEKDEFSYPAIIEGEDGSIHITYTFNRTNIKYVNLEILNGEKNLR